MTAEFLLTNSRTGWCSDKLTRSSTSSVIVAENNIVCRSRGHALMIMSSSSLKPTSSSRSASSRIKISIVVRSNECVFWTWSTRRPGVATTTSGRCRSSASCTRSAIPPTESPKVMSVNRASCFAIDDTCTASSRVGDSTRTRVARIFFGRNSSRSRHGSIKAAVFPEPVVAQAQRSRPSKPIGIARY